MIRTAHGHLTQHWQRLIVIGFVLMAVKGQFALAEQSADREVISARSANDELLRAIESRLATEQLTLQKLTELKVNGHATWLEFANAQAAVEALEAQQKTAREFGSFLAALGQQLAQPRNEINDNSDHDSDWLAALPAIALQIAALRAQAHGELDAAHLAQHRRQRHAATIERLCAANAASKDELVSAQNAMHDAHLLLTRLGTQHEADVKSFQQLLESTGECTIGNGSEAFANRELLPDEIPSALLDRHNFIRMLIAMRLHRQLASTERQTIASRLTLAAELVRRLDAAQVQNKPNDELNRARLDIEILQAQQRATEERLALLHLAEYQLVATAIAQPNEDISVVIRIDSPTSSLPLAREGIKTHLSAGQQSPLTAAAWQPIAPNWPINNWSATRQLIAPSLPLSGNANVRYSEPNYADFYIYGNLRLDAPSISNNFFRSGGLPWYLPGSTTNFK